MFIHKVFKFLGCEKFKESIARVLAERDEMKTDSNSNNNSEINSTNVGSADDLYISKERTLECLTLPPPISSQIVESKTLAANTDCTTDKRSLLYEALSRVESVHIYPSFSNLPPLVGDPKGISEYHRLRNQPIEWWRIDKGDDVDSAKTNTRS